MAPVATKAEMALFDNGKRGTCQAAALLFILTVPYLVTVLPTSVEAELAFSTAGIISNITSPLAVRVTREPILCFLAFYRHNSRKRHDSFHSLLLEG